MIDFKGKIVLGLSGLIESMEPKEIEGIIEVPADSNMGDYAFPCFKLARVFRKAPNLIAQDIAGRFGEQDYLESVVSVGGYINFKIDKELYVSDVVGEVLKERDKYGSSDEGAGKKVIVEFSSPNIAKPFHIGHIRTTVIGNSINKIYKFLGYETISINHLGDYGTQFGKLIVAFSAWGEREVVEKDPIKELLKLYIRFHEEAEKNPELEDQAREWFKKLENNDQEAFGLWQWFREVSLKEFSKVYDLLDIEFDSYAGESFYSDKMSEIVETMRQKNLLKMSQGAEIVDLEDYGMPPALITKSDGSTLYITRDIAAAKYRKETYDFFRNIYVVGSQQILHFNQLKKILELMGDEWAEDCIHVPFGMVALEDGTMSTRKGRVVFLEDVLKKAVERTNEIIEKKNPNLENKYEVARQIGIGAVMFQELSNSRVKDYVFSWEKTLSFEGETGPYVQYTHARCASLLRKGGPLETDSFDASILTDDVSMEIIRQLSKFKETVAEAGRKYEPAVVSRFVVDLAQLFNRFYHDHSIVVDDPKIRQARLALTMCVKQTLKNGLALLGMQAPEKM
ncbi:MAG: arginine--tRNA ligase [Peptostreptococcaceae bacterium]|nr:arginine--tRNA ligase [Peptostreptococcaceae bacterium]